MARDKSSPDSITLTYDLLKWAIPGAIGGATGGAVGGGVMFLLLNQAMRRD